jgi:hypothetical protein
MTYHHLSLSAKRFLRLSNCLLVRTAELLYIQYWPMRLNRYIQIESSSIYLSTSVPTSCQFATLDWMNWYRQVMIWKLLSVVSSRIQTTSTI